MMPQPRHVFALIVSGTAIGIQDMITNAELDYGCRCLRYQRGREGTRFKIIEEPEAKAPEEARR